MEDSSPRQEYIELMVKQIQAQVLEEIVRILVCLQHSLDMTIKQIQVRVELVTSLAALAHHADKLVHLVCLLHCTPLQVIVEDILPGQVQVMS